MTDRSLWTLYLCIAIFVLVAVIVFILVRRGGRSLETAKVLEVLHHTDKSIHHLHESVEGMRDQNSAEHSDLQDRSRYTNEELDRMTNRLGFLDAKKPGQHDPDMEAPVPRKLKL